MVDLEVPGADLALMNAASAFAEALPASVELPAGTGKTQLLAATVRHVVAREGRVLVLTHTNAGVHAIRKRLRDFGVTDNVRVATLTSFAFLLAGAYPILGQERVLDVPDWSKSAEYITAAGRIVASTNIRDVLSASYTHVLVDEYQDCSEDHHQLVCALANAVPLTGVLGDPLQAIFGFRGTKLITWDAVRDRFPAHATDVHPWRWVGHNEALGRWLLELRIHLRVGQRLSFHQLDSALNVIYRSSAGNRRSLAQVAVETPWPDDDSMVVLTAWKSKARSIGTDLHGRFTVMEEVAGDFMAKMLEELASLERDDYAGWLLRLVKKCTCGHQMLNEPVKSRLGQGKVVGDLARTRPGLEQALNGFDTVVTDPSFATLAAAMDTVMISSALRLHSHEAWFDIRTALVGAAAAGNDPAVLAKELVRARDKLRHQGRRDSRRVVSRTLLVKGLEYDHVIIDNLENFTDVNHLYVALTRARKSVTIIGNHPTITLTSNSEE